MNSTGQYYYNARWFDPNIGQFTTEDPIRYGLNWYIYANNNPLKFVDPSGLWPFHFGGEIINGEHHFTHVGWSHDAPQYQKVGYKDWMDYADNLIGFDLHATKITLPKNEQQNYDLQLRLWKGDYLGASGGEIGLYDKDGGALSVDQLKELGIKSTTMNLYDKNSGELVAGYTEGADGADPSGWTTDFNTAADLEKGDLYSENIFEFETVEQATAWEQSLMQTDTQRSAYDYPQNQGETYTVTRDDNILTVTYGTSGGTE